MPNFNFYNITFTKVSQSNILLVRGEIQNRSPKNYSAVAIRIVLFQKNIPLSNTVVVVNGLAAGQTRSFDKRIEEVAYDKAMHVMTRHEIVVDSAY